MYVSTFMLILVLLGIWLWSRTWEVIPPLPTPYDAACQAWDAADIAVYEASDQVEAARLAGDTDRWTYWLNEERRREIKREAAWQRIQILQPPYPSR
jgi:hypothetical protein